MKSKSSVFSVCCIVFLIIFAAFMIWYLPSASSLRAGIRETAQSLETSRGRERKQQDEYDQAVRELPLVQAELEEKLPQAEAAEEKVENLKARRKELKKEKEKLENAAAENNAAQEEGSHE